MGYEQRFFIVLKGNFKNENGYKWAELVAMFDYCKDYDFADFCNTFKDTDCYFYDNCNEVYEDCYGQKLKEIPLEDMINYLENNINNEYRRYYPLLSLLKGFQKEKEKFKNLVILRYGH